MSRAAASQGQPIDRVRWAFVALAMIWALLLPLATFAASRPLSTAPAWQQTFAYLVYRAGSIICHQRPERSFRLFSAQMPVCGRCTGIYLGGALVAAALVALRRRERRLPYSARTLLFAGVLPGVATLAYEWSTGQVPGNAIRALSGVPLGAAVMSIIGLPAPATARRDVIH